MSLEAVERRTQYGARTSDVRWLLAELRRLSEENEKLRAECERHRKANLVRAVLKGWNEEVDGALVDYVNERGWDAVPWKIAESFVRGASTEEGGAG